MCGRFTLTSSGEELARLFELANAPEIEARFNIAPTQPVAAVRCNARGERVLGMLRWGLVPHWAKDLSIGNRMINARSETADQKAAFREALERRRCIVPADGFYEWGGASGQRTPHLFRSRRGEPFGMAGLWERWRAPDGISVDSCTLLTTEANAQVRLVHDRMPVILDPRDYGVWLDRDEGVSARIRGLLVPAAQDSLFATRVSIHVNDVRHEDPACLEPAAE